ncbi:MAG TPA: hypothetical protein VK601_08110 [Kofleriaceae bacterium]|nr:hypothetical protein [Kofleriaceae bacterium]
MEACELLSVELRLDRIEAELATELPPHVRMFALAHARGSPAPPAPDALHRPVTLATARAALAHPVLADRGLALLRLAAPIAIEADPAVTAARTAEPTWTALSALAAARDAAARARFGRSALDVLHRLHGSAAHASARRVDGRGGGSHAPTSRGAVDAGDGARDARHARGGHGAVDAGSALSSRGDGAYGTGHALGGGGPDDGSDAPGPRGSGPIDGGMPPAVAGWFAADGVVVDDDAIIGVWEALRARHGVAGAVRFERAVAARPRAFVVDPGREVIVAIPARVGSPAERFAVLHELGHAVAALALPAGIPRVVDEAAAAYVARAIERTADAWYSPLAGAARARRGRLAQALDRIERELPEPPAAPWISERPPWALWHDPCAQAAYVAAESLADAIDQALGASPAPGALVAALAAHRTPIDRLGSGVYAV